MAGDFDISGLLKLQKDLEKLQAAIPPTREAIIKEMAKRFHQLVKHYTPIGQYPKSSGKVGGTMHRGWTTTPMRTEGDRVEIDVINPVEYAPYVDYGHRPANHKGWVPGRNITQKAINLMEKNGQKIVDRHVERMLREVFGGK